MSLAQIFLTLGTDGLYCVAKGINPVCALNGFCSNADLLFVNLISARTLFTSWSVTGSVVRVLKLFSRFKMRADVKD